MCVGGMGVSGAAEGARRASRGRSRGPRGRGIATKLRGGHGAVLELWGEVKEMDVVEIVDGLIRAMVDEPQEVHCEEIQGGNRTRVIEVSVASGDVGKVIGRRGANAEALRQLLCAIGGKNKLTYHLDLLQDGPGGAYEQQR